MRVAADTKLCIGSGSCAMTAPGVFEQHDEDGLVVIIDTKPPVSLHDDVRTAAQMCPTAAITVHDDEA